MVMPTVSIGHLEISRLIIGHNPPCGNSHVDEATSLDMRDYFTPEMVVKMLHDAEAAGINTWLARGDYHRVFHWLELFRREGGNMHWIAQTASEMHDVFQNIRVIAAAGAEAIYHHGTKTDQFWLTGQIDKTKDYLACMRDEGVLVGLCSHIPEVFDYAEEKGWDVDFYMPCFYNLSRQGKRESSLVSGKAQGSEDHLFQEGDPERICQFIQATDKTCIAFKILGASRKCDTQEDVRKAFQFAVDNIKPGDPICVGMFPKYEDQINLNVEHLLAAMEAPVMATA